MSLAWPRRRLDEHRGRRHRGDRHDLHSRAEAGQLDIDAVHALERVWAELFTEQRERLGGAMHRRAAADARAVRAGCGRESYGRLAEALASTVEDRFEAQEQL